MSAFSPHSGGTTPRARSSVPQPSVAERSRSRDPVELRQDLATLGSGEQIKPALRLRMDAGFGHHFDRVRIHSDAHADEVVSGLGARAATAGTHIAFRAGLYRPGTGPGDQLIAHELAHVVQQGEQKPLQPGPRRQMSSFGDARTLERQANRAAAAVATLERPPADLAPAPAATPKDPLTLTFVFRAPDDDFTKDVTAYTANTLGDKTTVQVDNMVEIVAYLDRLKAGGAKVGRIRLIGNGSTAGGIKMTPAGEKRRRFVSAEEIEQTAQNRNLRDTAAAVMTQDAVVEFWGCYVGGTEKTRTAVSTLFGSEFRATDETLHTQHEQFMRHPEKGEKGPVPVTSSAQVDKRSAKSPKLKADFEKWLLKRYTEAMADGGIPPRATRTEQIAEMREVFDPSPGTIRRLVIGEGGNAVGRGDKEWIREWKTTKVNGERP
jgi:hypothetical protein